MTGSTYRLSDINLKGLYLRCSHVETRNLWFYYNAKVLYSVIRILYRYHNSRHLSRINNKLLKSTTRLFTVAKILEPICYLVICNIFLYLTLIMEILLFLTIDTMISGVKLFSENLLSSLIFLIDHWTTISLSCKW